MKKLTLFVSMLIGILAAVQAGEEKYTIGEKISFKSDVLNEKRSIIVYTPRSYNSYTANYPVLYLLDGGGHFHHATGIVQFLSDNGLIPEMIVVGVQNVDRTRDFSPTKVEKWPETGGADKFMSYLKDELIPFMNQNYNTMPYEILMGHSFGGEFATYALLNNPEVFNAYIAISPYMMYDNNFIIGEAKTKLKSSYKNEVQFFMTVGDEPDYYTTLSEFERIVESKSPENFNFTYTKFENDNHGSVPHLSIYYGLECIYSGWKLTKEVFVQGIAAIDGHYALLSEEFGYEIVTPERTINQLGYYYLNEKEMEKAIKVFKENVKRNTNSANVYDSLGEAYENDGQLKEARENYQKAVKIANSEGHMNLSVYEKNLKRVEKELAQK